MFGIVCDGSEENVDQCRPRGGLCRGGDREFAVAIECGGTIDASEYDIFCLLTMYVHGDNYLIVTSN